MPSFSFKLSFCASALLLASPLFLVHCSDDDPDPAAAASSGGASSGTSGGGGSSSGGSSGSSGNPNSDGGGGGGNTDGGVTSAPSNYTCTKEIHVSPTGDDSKTGADAANALKTISKSMAKAEPGTCVKVHEGTYNEKSTINFPKDGTQAAPIVLWSVDGRGKAIIDNSGISGGPGILVRQDFVVIDGFEFKNMPTSEEQVVHFDGLKTGKCNGSVLRNNKITGGFDHIKLNQNSIGITIENNEFYGQFGHLPVSLTSASQMIFRFNFCHDWDTGENGAVQIKGGSHDTVFDGNRFQDIKSQAGTIALGDGCDSTCDIDPEHYAGVRLRAINNVMVRVGRGFDVQGCKDCSLLNNTFVDSGKGNVMFKLTKAATNGTSKDTTGTRIINNLIANAAGDQGSVMQINSPSGTGLQMDYNFVWNGSSGVEWGDGHPAGADTHSVTAKNPSFTSATDFSLAVGSPAIGVGQNLIADVPHDFTNKARPASGPFDMGAFQK